MKVSVILGHPNKGSFNHAIAETVVKTLKANGHQVAYHDLYKEKFNPVLAKNELADNAVLPPAIKKHCSEIAKAGGIVVIHPNWWSQPPAMVKGWVDRVFRMGVAYKFEEGDGGEGVPVGLFKDKTVLVFNTSNTPEEREKNVFGDPLQNLWGNSIFNFCGVKTFFRKMFGVVIISSPEERALWLENVRDTVNRYFPKT